jgi:mobilization protein MobC
MSHHSREFLKIDLLGLRGPLQVWCNQRGLTPSVAVRLMIAKATEATPTTWPPGNETPVSHTPIAGTVASRRLTLRLAHSDAKELMRQAQRAQLSVTRYLTSLVRFHADSAQELGGRALVAAVTESNYQLAAIGRNINQIAHAANINSRHFTPGDRETLLMVSAAIRGHIELAARSLVALQPLRSPAPRSR